MKCCFTSTETAGLLGTGAQDVHLDFHTAPELCPLYGGLEVVISVGMCGGSGGGKGNEGRGDAGEVGWGVRGGGVVR